MRLAALAALVLAVLIAVFLMRADPGPVSPTRFQPDRVASTAPRAAEPRPPQLTRDPFQYADRQGVSATRVARGEPAAAPPSSTLAAAVPIRLIGFVRISIDVKNVNVARTRIQRPDLIGEKAGDPDSALRPHNQIMW